MMNRRQLLGSVAAASTLGSVSSAFAFGTPQTFSIKDFTRDVEEIVRIDSPSGCAEGVRKVADVFTRRFESIGWTVTRHEIGKWGPGLVATNTPDQSAYDVILCGHMDTVQPVGHAAKYPFTVKGERAYGAGVADDKSSLTVLWYTVRDLPKDVLKNLRICVLLSPAEEVGPDDVNEFLIEYGRRGKYALVYEPGRPDGSFTKGRKSCTWIKVDFKGVSAHAGNNPQDGRNAIDAMALAIPQINSVVKDLPGVTINTGMVKGGTAVNTVADTAEVTFDLRTVRNEDTETVMKRVKALTEKGFAKDVKATMSIVSRGYAMEYNAMSDRLRKTVDAACSEAGFRNYDWLSVGGASDGNTLSRAGIGVVDSMGAVSGNLHNVEKEYVELTSVSTRIAIGKRTLAIMAANRKKYFE